MNTSIKYIKADLLDMSEDTQKFKKGDLAIFSEGGVPLKESKDTIEVGGVNLKIITSKELKLYDISEACTSMIDYINISKRTRDALDKNNMVNKISIGRLKMVEAAMEQVCYKFGVLDAGSGGKYHDIAEKIKSTFLGNGKLSFKKKSNGEYIDREYVSKAVTLWESMYDQPTNIEILLKDFK